MPDYHPEEHPLSHYPLLRLILPFSAGIVLGDAAYDTLKGCAAALVAAALVGAVVMAVLHRRRTIDSRPLLWIMTAVLLLGGAARLVSSREADTPPPMTGAMTFHAVAETPARATAKTFSLTITPQNGPLTGRRIQMALMRRTGDARPQPGDILLCRCTPEPPRDGGNPYDTGRADYLRRQGVAATALCFAGQWQPLHRTAENSSLQMRALRWRERLIAQYDDRIEGRELGIIAALTLGDKSRLDAATRATFSESGVSHVLALSGLHLGILFGIFQYLILRPVRRHRLLHGVLSLTGIAGLWLFTLIAGCPLSLMRAAMMFTLMLLTALARHEGSSMNHLVIAAAVITLVWPESLFDIGFQLSFSAVAGILLFQRRLPVPGVVKRHAPLRLVWDTATVTLCAQAATAPLVAYHFHALPLYGLAGNFVAVPMAYIVLLLALLFFLIPPLQAPLGAAMGAVVRGGDTLLSDIGRWPGASMTVSITPLTVAALYVILGALLLLSVRRRTALIYTIAAMVAVIGLNEARAARSRRITPQTVIYDLGGRTAVHFMRSADSTVLWLPRDTADTPALDRVRRTYWRICHIAEPLRVTGDTFHSSRLEIRSAVARFGHRRIALLDRRLPFHSSGVIAVDDLLLARGYRGSLRAALCFYAPRRVVLDASLSDERRARFRAEADTLGLPLHDIRRDGALVIKVDNEAADAR